jgi:hypothetical protein
MELESRILPKNSMGVIKNAQDEFAKSVYGDKFGKRDDYKSDMYFPKGDGEVKYDADVKTGLFSISNAKLADDATLIMNFTSALGCPSMNDCPITQKACYAVAGENRLKDVRRKNMIVQNLVAHAMAKNLLGGLFDIAELYIIEALKTKKPIKYIRYNEVGDFPNQKVLRMAAEFSLKVREKYGVLSMAYTSKKGIDPSEEIDGKPIDMIIAINRSRNDIPRSKDSVNRNYYGIGMGGFSSNPNINLDSSYCDVEFVEDDILNKLKVVAPEVDESGSPSIPVLTKGNWEGGNGYYYICPCSFWQYNKDKAILQFAIECGVVDDSYPIPESKTERKKLRQLLNASQNKKLNSILNKIKSPCGLKCSVCHDTHGGVIKDGSGKIIQDNIKDYAVLAATHGATASNYDAEYANAKRQGKDDVVYKGDKTNKHGLETKYKNRYYGNIPLNPELFNKTNESIQKCKLAKEMFFETYNRFFKKML